MPLSLNYQELGHDSGDVVIFLHGLFGSGRNLLSLAREYAEKYKIYLLDLRNHGGSPHDSNLNYELMSEDVLAFMDSKNISRTTLIGHSMGGKTAMATALTAPDLISQLVVMDIAPVDYSIDYLPLINRLLAIKTETLKNRAEADEELSQFYGNQMFRQFLLQNLTHTDGCFRWRLNLPAIKEHIGKITSFPDFSGAAYHAPCLFLTGADSEYVLPEHSEIIHRLFPSASIQTIPAAGHWLQADQPERVADEIGKFLDFKPE